MIRSSLFYRIAELRRNGCMPRSTSICGCGTSRSLRRDLSRAQTFSSNKAGGAEKKGKAKAKSFFEEVDERMKRDSPVQYRLFLESKAKWESKCKLEQQRDVLLRRRVVGGRKANMPVADSSAQSTTPHMEKPPVLEYHGKRDSTYPAAKDHPQADDAILLSNNATTIDDRTVSFETTISSWDQKIINNRQDPPIPTASNDKLSNKKGGGVFSSISKNALLIKSANVSIPLSELFPTLYATESPAKTVTSKQYVDPVMMFDPDDFEAYEQAITAVFEDDGTVKAIARIERKAENKEYTKIIIQQVKDWLLNKQRIVEPEVMMERWNNVDEAWKNGKWMTGLSESEPCSQEEPDAKKSDSMFTTELRSQQQLFLSILQEKEFGRVPRPDGETPEQDDVAGTAFDPILFYEVAQHFIGSLGRYCARRARSTPMVVAWWKVKESGLLLRKDVTANFLYVCSTMGVADSIGMSSGVGAYFTRRYQENGGESTIDNEQSRFLIPEEVATYHDLSSKPTESSISLRVKALASKGNAKSAEELVEAFKASYQSSILAYRKSIEADESSEGELVRLRTYFPILKQYCEVGDMSSALSLFKRMQSTPGVMLEPETYVLLLASIAENKYFCDDSPELEGATAIGYSHSRGPGLFDELATEMACEALEISSASARRLYNSLAIGFQSKGDSESNNSVVSNLKEAHPLMSMALAKEPAKSNEVVACRVSLDRGTGVCPVTNVQQRLIILEPDQRKQLHADLLDLSTEQFAKFAGKKSNDAPGRAREQLQVFSDWLDQRQGTLFTAIVDGANVGYYMQSFDKGRFNYHQIKFMVDTLEARGETPLVIIPNKYAHHEFFSSRGENQRLDRAEIEIMDDLTKSGKLYKVPPRCLDDFYWMLASISDQTASRDGQDISIPNNDPYGRFPGSRPMLITNDQMRDHRYELLDPRLFRRWYGCHIVNYNFTAFVLGESVAGNEIGFSLADFFSREIQGNPCPSNSDDGYNSNWGGNAWHFPVQDWQLDERFVIRIPKKIEN